MVLSEPKRGRGSVTESPKSAEPSAIPKPIVKLLRWYADAAVAVLSTLVLFLGFVLLSYAYYAIPGKEDWKVYSRDFQPRAMHRMDTEQALRFFKEFDRMGQDETFIYQPWVGFSERVFHSPRLNVDNVTPLPTRRTVQNGSRGDGRPLIIWTFGGSTMFGWGVPDDETIASHLSAILSRDLPDRTVTVTNHGHSYYFSSQELSLFQILLRRGERCDVAVFLDGLNDSFPYSIKDMPEFTDRMRIAMEREQQRNPTAQTYYWVSPDFPPVRLLRAIGKKITGRAETASRPAQLPTLDIEPDVNTYQFNLKAGTALGEIHGVKTLFFWQPVPDGPLYTPSRNLAVRIRQAVKADNFHFIADIFKQTDPLDVYVDFHHYGDVASERIADEMAREVLATLPREQSKPK